MHSLTIPTACGYAVPLSWHPADSARANLLLMAALGVPAGFYKPLAEQLAQAGFNVALMEHRGHGESGLRASRRVDFGFREVLVEDIPAVLEWMDEQAPGLPVYLMGHSLGGHYAAMTAGRLPSRIAGVILVACGSPWKGAFTGKTRHQIGLLCHLIPLFSFLLGYYPGDRVGFGGREARTLMRDWRHMAVDNSYRATGLDEDLDAGIGVYQGPVLSVRPADDAFAPAAAMAAVTDKFQQAVVSYSVLSAGMLGERADHYRWVRRPQAVVQTVVDWMDKAGSADHSSASVLSAS